MQRIIYILLLSLLYGLFGVVNYVEESLSESVQPTRLQQIVDESNTTDKDTDRAYDKDMLRTPTHRCIAIEEVSSISTPTSSARYRTSTSQKIMATAIPNRHEGHVTKIFEFNSFTSSLRIAYYLYALCRLRI
ncbi:MAG: hypothetical protein IKA38_08830 [Alistipes sp.]|nr:hypothetical protein [Alistipes sp.]MBR2332566.1 hypothetical protein [Alistipes sp.]MBR6661715.1 hypothetical protein [Alistipes sp.]